jgi:Grx4 family monothiol glutaredoxin
MNDVVLELAKKYPNVLVLQVEADQQSDITESFDVESVPTFLILRVNSLFSSIYHKAFKLLYQGHTLLSRISGADAEKLTSGLETHTRVTPEALSKTTAAPARASDYILNDEKEGLTEELTKRLIALKNQSDVVLFMKGTPETPRCGFSRKIVAILQERRVGFTTFDILTDESVRQGLKKLNDWPTFPQLIVKGELIGGLDIVNEMDEEEWESTFGEHLV